MSENERFLHSRIFIVDDQKVYIALLDKMLRAAGYDNIRATSDSREAAAIYLEWSPDIMITDLNMPEVNGFQVIEEIKRRHPHAYLPVLMITADESPETRLKALEIGVKGFLNRPFDMVEVLSHIRNILSVHFLMQDMQKLNTGLQQRVDDATAEIKGNNALLERRLQEMMALAEVSVAISSLLDVDRVLEMIMDKSKEVMGAEASSLLMLDKESGKLRFHVARGVAGTALKAVTVELGQGIAGWVAQTGDPILIPDAYQDPRFDPSYDKKTGFRTRSILTVPLKVKDDVIGVVQVINKVGQDSFDQHDLDLFLTFASQASVAVDNARLYEQTRQMAEDLRNALESERRLSIEKEKMGAYIPKHVVDEISRNREKTLALGGKTAYVTILFSDIQGFTRLSETLEPQKIVGFLNIYMTAMTNIIEEEGGFIDKFIGDGIMAIFPAHEEDDDSHALNAIRAGVRMQRRITELREQWQTDQPEVLSLQVRIGVNTGDVVAGNIGSETRMDYTVVGDNVNVASRLESSARAGEVLISEATYQHVQDIVPAKRLEPILVKNRIQPVQSYSVTVPEDGSLWEKP